MAGHFYPYWSVRGGKANDQVSGARCVHGPTGNFTLLSRGGSGSFLSIQPGTHGGSAGNQDGTLDLGLQSYCSSHETTLVSLDENFDTPFI